MTSTRLPETPLLSLADEAYVVLRRRIVRCDLAPGAPLHARDLADDLGLGLTPVREALRRLHRERLVITQPRRGYQVMPLTEVRLRDTMAAWRIVKPRIAAVAVAQAGPDAAERLGDGLEGVHARPREGAADEFLAEVAHARSRAWLLLAAETGNSLLTDVARHVDGHVLRLQHRVGERAGEAVADQQGAVLRTLAGATPPWPEILRHRDADAAALRATVEGDILTALVTPHLAAVADDVPDAGTAAVTRFSRPGSLSDAAWETLRDLIVLGRIAPGTRVTERTLAAGLGLGLTPVREALGRLDDERLVTTSPRSGYRVTRLTPKDVVEATQAWALVTPPLVALAVEHATPQEADAIVTSMCDPGDGSPAAIVAHRRRGWQLLAAASGNTVLAECLNPLTGVVARLLVALLQLPNSPVRTAPVDWATLFAARDAGRAQEQAERYADALVALGAWAADRLPPTAAARGAD